MRLDLFRQIARQLMKEHGLYDRGWRYETDNARVQGRFGQCRYRSKKVVVSKWVIQCNRQKWAVDVLLHEIAHAIAGYDAAHGKPWFDTFKRIGGSGMVGYPDAVIRRPKKLHPRSCRKQPRILESRNEGARNEEPDGRRRNQALPKQLEAADRGPCGSSVG